MGAALRRGRRRRDRRRHDQVRHRRSPGAPGPGAPRWTSSPASAKARPGTRRATPTSAASSARPPSAPASTQTREGARYRKLARSRGKNKACVAVGNTQLKVYHKLLSNPGMRYEDLGPDYYERQAATRRKIAYHVREIEAVGFEVTLCPHPRSRGRARGRQPRTHSPRCLTHPPASADGTNRRRQLPRAQLRSYFRASNNRHRQRRTPADVYGRSCPGQERLGAGSPHGELASGRRGQPPANRT